MAVIEAAARKRYHLTNAPAWVINTANNEISPLQLNIVRLYLSGSFRLGPHS